MINIDKYIIELKEELKKAEQKHNIYNYNDITNLRKDFKDYVNSRHKDLPRNYNKEKTFNKLLQVYKKRNLETY